MRSTKPLSKANHQNVYLVTLIIVALIATGWTLSNTFHFLTAEEKTWSVKTPLMLSLIVLYASSYGIFLIIYSKWAEKTKEKLFYLILKDARVVFVKFNRYFINKELVRQLGYKPSSFTKLSQKDLCHAVDLARHAKKEFH
jgi:hypothetical protein